MYNIYFLIILSFFLSNCSTTNNSVDFDSAGKSTNQTKSHKSKIQQSTHFSHSKENINKEPIWILQPQINLKSNQIASIGIAPYSKYGEDEMLPQAIFDAKIKLASIIQEKIIILQEKVSQQLNINIKNSYFETISVSIVSDIHIINTKVINKYHNPKTKELYIRLMMPISKINKNIKNSLIKQYEDKTDLSQKAIKQMIQGIKDQINKGEI